MNTFGVNFIVRRNSKNRKIAHLFARITVNEEVVESALKGRVDSDCWLSKKEEFKGKTEEVNAWNKYVENTRFRITQQGCDCGESPKTMIPIVKLNSKACNQYIPYPYYFSQYDDNATKSWCRIVLDMVFKEF